MQQLTIVQANTVLFIGESSVEIIPKTGLFSGGSSVEEIISKNRFVCVRFRFFQSRFSVYKSKVFEVFSAS